MNTNTKIKKTSKVENARVRLEKAIDGLEESLKGSIPLKVEVGKEDSGMSDRLKFLETENAQLKTSKRLAANKLEQAIKNLKSLLFVAD